MRFHGLASLADALAAKAKQAPQAPENASPALPVATPTRRRPVRVLSAAETAENRRFHLIQHGLAFYSEVRTVKTKEPDPNREYLGPRFSPPKAKPNPGCRY